MNIPFFLEPTAVSMLYCTAVKAVKRGTMRIAYPARRQMKLGSDCLGFGDGRNSMRRSKGRFGRPTKNIEENMEKFPLEEKKRRAFLKF